MPRYEEEQRVPEGRKIRLDEKTFKMHARHVLSRVQNLVGRCSVWNHMHEPVAFTPERCKNQRHRWGDRPPRLRHSDAASVMSGPLKCSGFGGKISFPGATLKFESPVNRGITLLASRVKRPWLPGTLRFQAAVRAVVNGVFRECELNYQRLAINAPIITRSSFSESNSVVFGGAMLSRD